MSLWIDGYKHIAPPEQIHFAVVRIPIFPLGFRTTPYPFATTM